MIKLTRYQPDILLHPDAIDATMHTLFSLSYASVIEDLVQQTGDRTLLYTSGCRLEEWAPQQDPSLLVPFAWYLIGRIAAAWKVSVGLVFHHAGITSIKDQTHALTHLFLGCIGHGVTLADDFNEQISQAETVFRKAFDPVPVYADDNCIRILAQDAAARVRKAQEFGAD